MQKNLIILVFLCPVFYATAQKTKQQTYFYTQISEKYFTDAEIDSLLYRTSQTIFKENMVPEVLFDKHYTVVKSLLIGTIRNNTIASFKAIEKKMKRNLIEDNGSQEFADNKKLYTEVLLKQVRTSFYTNKYLQSYISFNSSDRITYFNSTIRVGKDGKLMVQEKITVNNGSGNYHPVYGTDSSLQYAGAINDEIKRGIVRAFPLYYV
ncbi:MAG: hypothetical protein WBC06_09390, partial [Chitinophagaceae bacterium]